MGYYRKHPTLLAGGLVFQWRTSGSPVPKMVLSRSEDKELNSKSVLIAKWTKERSLNKPGVPAGKRIQLKSKEIEAISGTLAFLDFIFLKIALDFHLRQFVGKMVLSPQVRCH